MKIANTYPGINAGEFVWEDADKNLHKMEEMELAYLENVRRRLEHMKAYDNAEDHAQLTKKLSELDKAISVVKEESRKEHLSESLTQKASASDFDINDLASH